VSAPFAEIASFFDALVDQHGDDPRSSDWSGAASQRLRFSVLADVLDLDGLSVLDVGCGVGAFADYLAERRPRARYAGIDLSERAIAVARRARPHLEFRTANLLEAEFEQTYDVVIANGIFYRLGERGPELMPALVERMWRLARLAVAFNSLSAWAPGPPAEEFHADPVEALEHCRTLTRSVVLRHDYLPHDFTIYLRR
jgi:SAM-dependent methyltransferase